MPDTPSARLAALGLALPDASAPAGSYVPTQLSGDLLFVSGQLPMRDGSVVHTGAIDDTSIEEGVEAARLCALNVLAQASAALGDLGRVETVLRLGGFVSAGPDFTRHPLVINGASDLMVAVFGDAGRHARAAVGVSGLPMGASVEVEAVLRVSHP